MLQQALPNCAIFYTGGAIVPGWTKRLRRQRPLRPAAKRRRKKPPWIKQRLRPPLLSPLTARRARRQERRPVQLRVAEMVLGLGGSIAVDHLGN